MQRPAMVSAPHMCIFASIMMVVESKNRIDLYTLYVHDSNLESEICIFVSIVMAVELKYIYYLCMILIWNLAIWLTAAMSNSALVSRMSMLYHYHIYTVVVYNCILSMYPTFFSSTILISQESQLTKQFEPSTSMSDLDLD